MSHEDFSEQIGAYLLYALPDDEHATFEEHLASCAECRVEVDHLRVAADALPNSPVQLTPPPALKGRIMEIVNREAELLRAAGPEADRVPAAAVPRKRRSLSALLPEWLSLRPGLAVAATALILAVGAAGALVGQSAMDDGETQVVAQVGNAHLIQREGNGHSTLVAHNLEQPDAGHVYQVWLKRKGESAPSPTNALFSSRSDGTASVDVPGDLSDVEQVLVTEEPDGGSPAPTSTPLIVADIA